MKMFWLKRSKIWFVTSLYESYVLIIIIFICATNFVYGNNYCEDTITFYSIESILLYHVQKQDRIWTSFFIYAIPIFLRRRQQRLFFFDNFEYYLIIIHFMLDIFQKDFWIILQNNYLTFISNTRLKPSLIILKIRFFLYNVIRWDYDVPLITLMC